MGWECYEFRLKKKSMSINALWYQIPSSTIVLALLLDWGIAFWMSQYSFTLREYTVYFFFQKKFNKITWRPNEFRQQWKSVTVHSSISTAIVQQQSLSYFLVWVLNVITWFHWNRRFTRHGKWATNQTIHTLGCSFLYTGPCRSI